MANLEDLFRMAKAGELPAMVGLRPDAEPADVKRAYRKRAMELHPDRNPGDADAAARLRALNEAYDAWSRSQSGAQPATEQPGVFNQDELQALFSDFLGGKVGPLGAHRGGDLQVSLSLTEAEARRGVRRIVEVTREAPCGTCDATGAAPGSALRVCPACAGAGRKTEVQGSFRIDRTCEGCTGVGRIADEKCSECSGGWVSFREKVRVDVPAGVAEGYMMGIPGKGNTGVDGASGRLYVALTIAPGVEGGRKGDDAHIDVEVAPEEARDGARVVVAGPDGDLEVDVPAGVRDGERITLPGRGYVREEEPGAGVYREAAARGSLVVTVRVRRGSGRERIVAAAVALGAVAAAIAAFLMRG